MGKSSLFNAILGRRQAIVHEESGITRDRIVASVFREGHYFQVVDTGGLGTFTAEKKRMGLWDEEIRRQVDVAVEGADILLFVTDITAGVTALDVDIAAMLRSSGKKVFLIANKADNPEKDAQSADFLKLGFSEIFPVSCVHRRGIPELIEKIICNIDVSGVEQIIKPALRIAIVGRPNVGKSSLINHFLGEERVIVSDIPGTTRDSVDVEFELKYKSGKIPAVFVDTAGLRKKGRADSAVEIFSIMRAERAIKHSQLVLFLIEAGKDGATAQDRHIGRMIADSGKGCIIIVNKWDTCAGLKQKTEEKKIRAALPFMTYAPIIFTSALSAYNFSKILDSIAEVKEQMELHIPTSVINRLIADAFERNSPSVIGRGPFKVYYATMLGNEPPRFLFFVNDPKLCPKNYLAYLNNYLRQRLDLTGLPIRIQMRNRPEPKSK